MSFNYNHIIVVITHRIFSSHQEVSSGPFAVSSLSYLLHLSESLFKKDSCSSTHNSTQTIFLLDQEATCSLRSRIRPLIPASQCCLIWIIFPRMQRSNKRSQRFHWSISFHRWGKRSKVTCLVESKLRSSPDSFHPSFLLLFGLFYLLRYNLYTIKVTTF